MSRQAIKTDHSNFKTKLKLRLDNLPEGKSLCVLDCFSGEGLLWNEIQKQRQDLNLSVLAIDLKKKSSNLGLVGNNLKFLFAMDFRQFDIIDLDAYGSPYKQLSVILNRQLKPNTIFFCTFIQTMIGALPHGMLKDLGYSRSMIEKIPTLFYRHGNDKMLAWLGNKSIKSVKIYSDNSGRKNYFSFSIS